ncbi:MAG: hypothetical protein ABIE68_02650 [bacterium]
MRRPKPGDWVDYYCEDPETQPPPKKETKPVSFNPNDHPPLKQE